MTMIEKVARAIDSDAFEYSDEFAQEMALQDAKAAIEAMMEADTDILAKGLKAWHRNLGVEGQPDWSVMRKTWQAMLREALKE